VENPLADIDRIRAIADPGERAVAIGDVLNRLPAVAKELREDRRTAVLQLRDQGKSFGQIAEQLKIHRNRVQQIAEGRSDGGRAGTGELPTAVREFKDGRTLNNPAGRTFYEIVTAAPYEQVVDLVERAKLGKNLYFTPLPEGVEIRTISRISILRVHDVLTAAGCEVLPQS
jgi:hypothetical protein